VAFSTCAAGPPRNAQSCELDACFSERFRVFVGGGRDGDHSEGRAEVTDAINDGALILDADACVLGSARERQHPHLAAELRSRHGVTVLVQELEGLRQA
jgi:NAD(P)H-hydrate repair Nnr-like enzyme with NAD(P)H-hydrate dehydratase domain